MKNTGRFLLAFVFLAIMFVPEARAQGTILVDPDAPFEELFTLPLLPVPDDPKVIPPLPEEVKKIINAEAVAVFDTSIIKGGLNGYPFTQTKISAVVNNNIIAVVTALIDDDFNAPYLDENSILEIKWFSTDPANLNSPRPKIKTWVNFRLIEKILEEMMGGKKPDEKIKI